jgi:hypothetical protein
MINDLKHLLVSFVCLSVVSMKRLSFAIFKFFKSLIMKLCDTVRTFHQKSVSSANDFFVLSVLILFICSGKLSGKVYSGNPKLTELIGRVYAMFTLANALHTDIFHSSRRCESEIIKMTARMLHANENSGVCGTMTSGGTDSIFMAMKAYRDWARVTLHIFEPEVYKSQLLHSQQLDTL